MTRSEEADHGVVIKNEWYDDWIKDIPDLTGKVAIVTGANSGTGFWASAALAGKGCTVVLACRNATKAKFAKEEILELYSNAKVDIIVLDNMDFGSIHSFVKEFNSKYDRLDYLLNNAGIMAQPLRKSKDGYDIQIQTNHLSHFLLTKLLWDKLVKSSGQARVVHHSSAAHSVGYPKFDPNHLEDGSYSLGWFGMNIFIWNILVPIMGYPKNNWMRYGVSKLANVLFMKELAQRIESKGLQETVITVACHPGYANTNLQNVAKDSMPGWEKSNANMAQSAADGSLPLLMATVGKDMRNGEFVGPEKNTKGLPKIAAVGGNGNNKAMAEELWQFSETCVKETFEI